MGWPGRGAGALRVIPSQAFTMSALLSAIECWFGGGERNSEDDDDDW